MIYDIFFSFSLFIIIYFIGEKERKRIESSKYKYILILILSNKKSHCKFLSQKCLY
jgi:hypothetical protein